MPGSIDNAPTNYTFPDPESINILGMRENEGRIYEADVQFRDFSRHQWYITILDGDGFIRESVESFETVSIDDVTEPGKGDSVEPPKFVWNGELSEAKVKEIISASTMQLLMPFLVQLG